MFELHRPSFWLGRLPLGFSVFVCLVLLQMMFPDRARDYLMLVVGAFSTALTIASVAFGFGRALPPESATCAQVITGGRLFLLSALLLPPAFLMRCSLLAYDPAGLAAWLTNPDPLTAVLALSAFSLFGVAVIAAHRGALLLIEAVLEPCESAN